VSAFGGLAHGYDRSACQADCERTVAAGTPQPQAAIAATPAGIAAVSAWGLGVMTRVVLTAAILVLLFRNL